jgi:hypothetical protein
MIVIVQFLADQNPAINPPNKKGVTPIDEAQGQFSATADETGVRRPAYPSTEALLRKLLAGK